MRFNSSRSQDTSGPQGLDGPGWELKLSSAKKMIGGCFRDYSAGHYLLKTFNGQLNIVLGRQKG